jgi:sortase A
MRPDDHTNNNQVPSRPQNDASLDVSRPVNIPERDATLSIVRGQLDAIYGGETTTPTPQTTPVLPQQEEPAPDIVEQKPIKKYTVNTAIEPDQWQQYHTAWQDYYKQYYERSYLNHIYEHQQKQVTPALPQSSPVTALESSDTFDQKEAIHDLRAKLLTSMQTSAVKVRKSRHFTPIVAALCVIFVFLFLQYNRVLFANVEAYVSPGSIDPANIIVDPTTNVNVSPDPKLIIPKINVDVPVNYDTTPDYDAQMKAMENGVAWFGINGANSKPGQVGNTVLSGHSSNDIIDSGSYKFIFARLDQLVEGDTVYVNYQGTRYVYTVKRKEVVKPTEVNKLVYATDKPILTLITCTPLGTSLNRLLVTAEQVSPDPNGATAAPATSSSTQTSIPGNSPTFLQRVFGGGN